MNIERVHLVNFRRFHGRFNLDLKTGVNVLVGDNNSGKSTIMEAINLVLSGLTNGRYLSNELNQFMFNDEVVRDYLRQIESGLNPELPEIRVELVFSSDAPADLEGNGNLDRVKARGVSLSVAFDPDYAGEYEALLGEDEQPTTLPIEYYRATWTTFARENITIRSMPMKAAMIDSSSARFQSGTDVYISRIIRDHLSDVERVQLAQAYRKMKDGFVQNGSVESINAKLSKAADLPDDRLSVSANLTTKSAWETILSAYLDEIPFQEVGKGTQSIIKTRLALTDSPGTKPNVILLEEPENHLSHGNLNALLADISTASDRQQAIVSTHSSFVANKLGLNDLILLHDGSTLRLSDLPKGTQNFFRKLPGYETLRLLLCRRMVLVEGPSDELIFQRAYMDHNGGTLPIEDGVDVMSVGLTFKRFLEIARRLSKQTAVITDNDGNYKRNIEDKYQEFLSDESIAIFADDREHLRTLEPQIADSNSADLDNLRIILGMPSKGQLKGSDVASYMESDKVQSALAIFDSKMRIEYPKYIVDAVVWCRD